MPYEFISYETKGRIAYVTIRRPERLNALHPYANQELLDAFTAFREDPDAWVAILTGTGERAFSAGNDLVYTAQHGGARPGPRAAFGGITTGFECWKPIIAAVNGYALGGGLELAMACDIIIAAEHAELGLPEPRVGLFAGAGGVHRLPRHVPHKIAMGMLLTARRIPAQEAYRIGLVNEVVPMAELMPTAERGGRRDTGVRAAQHPRQQADGDYRAGPAIRGGVQPELHRNTEVHRVRRPHRRPQGVRRKAPTQLDGRVGLSTKGAKKQRTDH